ncbi:MAG: bifunctional riboflavin kinase/FAD synthetase [Candidatus Zixiibacteriota bacterium]
MGAVYYELDEAPHTDSRVISVGNFDGFHVGHKAIIDGVMNSVGPLGAEGLLVTFRPHPRYLIAPESAPQLILTPEEELETLREVFPGDILLMKFDETIRNMSARQFIETILIRRLSLKALVSGENNTIGKDRVGDRDRLRQLSAELGFEFVVVNPVKFDSDVVSSTAIRRFIADGDLPAANRLLETPYRISGEVIRGMGLGRKLGYPTANLEFNQFKALPKEGVYAADVKVNDEVFGCMMFVGRNYLNPEEAFSVEAHILGFDRDIYGDVITYYPFEFVRENLPIRTTDELVEQLGKDKIAIECIMKTKETSGVC